MKKIFLTSLIVLMSNSLVAQEGFYTQTLKEFIAIQTLIAENRISDLSNFLDEYSYIAASDNWFAKFDLGGTFPENLSIAFLITDNNNIMGIITKKDNDNKTRFEMTKSELHSLWANLLSNIETGMPYNMFKLIKDSFINKDGEGLEESEYQIINRYKIKAKGNKEADWQTYSASNFNSGLKTNEKYWVYTFMGPGKLDWIDIYFNKFDEKNSNENVPVGFYFQVQKNYQSYEDKDPINIPFFMSLKNFNDRIWNDN